MEEQTTTDAPVESGGQTIQGVVVDDQGMAVPQPETPAEPAEAVEPTTETSEPQTKEVQPTEPSDDDQLTKWAEAKGLKLDSDNAIKAAKMAREAEKAMHSKAQKASELERSMSAMSDESAENIAEATGQDPEVLKRLQRMEVKNSIRDFWDANPDARNYESEMTKIATEAGLSGTPEAILKAAYAIAKTADTEAVKSQGKKEVLESLAAKQSAAVPTGNAVTPTASAGAITPENVDQMVASHDLDWYRKNQEAINKAVAGIR